MPFLEKADLSDFFVHFHADRGNLVGSGWELTGAEKSLLFGGTGNRLEARISVRVQEVEKFDWQQRIGNRVSARGNQSTLAAVKSQQGALRLPSPAVPLLPFPHTSPISQIPHMTSGYGIAREGNLASLSLRSL